jgi:microcystin-dependent protein
MGSGLGPGLASRTLGTKLGEENHPLATAEMPSHTHTYLFDDWLPTGGTIGFVTGQPQDTYELVQDTTGTTGATGGAGTAGFGKTHNNIQPSTVVQFIIRV